MADDSPAGRGVGWKLPVAILAGLLVLGIGFILGRTTNGDSVADSVAGSNISVTEDEPTGVEVTSGEQSVDVTVTPTGAPQVNPVTPEPELEIRVTAVESVLNVRAEPVDGQVLATVRASTLFGLSGESVVDDSGGEWVEVTDLHGAVLGWVSAQFLAEPVDLESRLFANRHSVLGNEFGTLLNQVRFPDEMIQRRGEPIRITDSEGRTVLGWPGSVRLGFNSDDVLVNWEVGDVKGARVTSQKTFDTEFDLEFEGTLIDEETDLSSVQVGGQDALYLYIPSQSDPLSWPGLAGWTVPGAVRGFWSVSQQYKGLAEVVSSDAEFVRESFGIGTGLPRTELRYTTPPVGTKLPIFNLDATPIDFGSYPPETTFLRVRLGDASVIVPAPTMRIIERWEHKPDGFFPDLGLSGDLDRTRLSRFWDDIWFEQGLPTPTPVPIPPRSWECSSPGGPSAAPWTNVTSASATLTADGLVVRIDIEANPSSAGPTDDPFWAIYLGPTRDVNDGGYQVSAYYYPEGSQFLFLDFESFVATPGAIRGSVGRSTVTMRVDRSFLPRLGSGDVYAVVEAESGRDIEYEDRCGGSIEAMTLMR